MGAGSDGFGFSDVDMLIFPTPLTGQIAVATHFAFGLEADELVTRQRSAPLPLTLKHARNPADAALSILGVASLGRCADGGRI